jgi:hypothetical protein
MNNPVNKRNLAPSAGEPVSTRVTVLIVGCSALSRIITHLFASGPDFEVVGSLRGLKSLAPQAERLLPNLIVAGVKPVGSGVDATVRTIRRASPLSKVILLCPIGDFVSGTRRFGADACLDPEKLIAQLLPTAVMLSGSGNSRSKAL